MSDALEIAPGWLCSVCHAPTGIKTPMEALAVGLVQFALCSDCRGVTRGADGALSPVRREVLSVSLRQARALAQEWPSRCEGSA